MAAGPSISVPRSAKTRLKKSLRNSLPRRRNCNQPSKPITKRRGVLQTILSPAHPESGRLTLPEIEDRIRNRAYQLYEDRGYGDGHALDDWLEAKAEVLGVVKNRNAA